MLPSSEIIIKPGKSKVYFRLVLVLYVFTLELVYHSSLHVSLLLLLILFLCIRVRIDWKHQSPCPTLRHITCSNGRWTINWATEGDITYDSLNIVIHNPLFQLIKMQNSEKKYFLILFNDQIPKAQWRYLHLCSGKIDV
ncbi:hypothetical protein Lsha_0943 [Legionella shakespearei DSM 23087]|uniref:Transmembrane protein n=1 Tax=Legionella shakespearei DSM 23087 TaxID=1122169 RepID=A0A0W0Z0V4_9GAMM|nr:hypothetical protein Lsha_0943 [Legionella shakespearei DSM 23087]